MERYMVGALLATIMLWLRKKQQKRVLHIKGFASFYDRTRALLAVNYALEFINKFKPSKVVWDGDDYNAESFSAVISSLSVLRNDILRRFHLFACKGDVPRARSSWDERLNGRLDCTETSIVPTQRVKDATTGVESFVFCQTDYKNLGLSALRTTQATDVLVLGVGPCVTQEIQEAASALPHVTFHVVDIPRYTSSSVKQSLGVLFDSVPANVKVIGPISKTIFDQ